jgi:hypothetical protein
MNMSTTIVKYSVLKYNLSQHIRKSGAISWQKKETKILKND